MRTSLLPENEDVSDSARRRAFIARAVVALTLVMIATQVGGFLFTASQQRALLALRNDTREMRIVQQALVDEKESVEDYLLTGDPASLQAYFIASETLQAYRTTALRRLDAAGDLQSGATLAAFDAMDGIWDRAIKAATRNDSPQGAAIVAGDDARRLLGRLRGSITRYIDRRNIESDRYERRIELGSLVVLMLQLFGGGSASLVSSSPSAPARPTAGRGDLQSTKRSSPATRSKACST